MLALVIAYTQKGQLHQKTSQLHPYKGDKNKRISDLTRLMIVVKKRSSI